MRNKIDYGIDLGTTNSAIARMENGVPTIKKSDTLKDTLPSCVHFNRRQDILVGDTAFNVMKNDNARALRTFEAEKTNTFIEFKRTMGTTHKYKSTNMKREFSSEELSSEVLKKLKSFIQEENLSSIVITVPAKFLNPQKEATIQAAKLAGFKHIELLQEPVAAATAYGLTAKDKDSYWLVFDFGGGTFDSAILKAEEGILTVKDTEGDNRLGGKNLDEAIVDQIIIPYLQDNYAIADIVKDSIKKEVLRNAVKPYAEETKNQLSFKSSHTILSNLGDLPIEDDNGDELEIDITVTQKDMEYALAPIFQKAINITKKLLQRNNLKGEDLGTLILVGGPTYSPILQRMLKEQITENVDASVDPMTIVAKGAALFASTISVSEEVKEASRDKTKLQIDIKYEATSVEKEEMVSLKILREKTIGKIPEVVFADVVRGDGAWSSGKKRIDEKAELIDVLLEEGCSNVFTINVYDEPGNKLECQPNQFNILQGIGGLEGMSVLPYYIGIGKWFDSEEKDLFTPVKGLEKNKKIPAIGVINGLKTRSTVRPGMANDSIKIPIYEGDFNAEGTNPILNNLIHEVIISGDNLPALLPEDSNVDITIKVDRSEHMHFSAYFPLIDHTEEMKIQIKQQEPPKEEKLKKDIADAKRTASRLNNSVISGNLEALEHQLENEKGSADGRLKILDGLRKELLQLEKLEKAEEWPNIEQELKNVFFNFEELIEKIKRNKDFGNMSPQKINSQVLDFKQKTDVIIREKNRNEGKELIKEISSTRLIILIKLIPENFIRDFDSDFGLIQWKNPSKARSLINQGKSIILSKYDNDQLSDMVIAIIKEMLFPDQLTGTLY